MYCDCFAKGFFLFIQEISVVRLANVLDAKIQKIQIAKKSLTLGTTRKQKGLKIPTKSLQNLRKGLAIVKDPSV